MAASDTHEVLTSRATEAKDNFRTAAHIDAATGLPGLAALGATAAGLITPYAAAAVVGGTLIAQHFTGLNYHPARIE